MADYLCISATFLDPCFHGRGDDAELEWPPSPLRLFQALLAANADQLEPGGDLERALRWLEGQPPPAIIAPQCARSSPYCVSVPNNAMDIVAGAWIRGNYSGVGNANPAKHRAMKTVRAMRMSDSDAVHYLWPLADSSPDANRAVERLADAAGRMISLGWGIDLIVGRGARIASSQLDSLKGERWESTTPPVSVALRTPVPGTLVALQAGYCAFLNRIGEAGFVPVAPLTKYAVVGYRRSTDPLARPHESFELRHDSGSLCQFPQRKLVHLAGMVRHLAIAAMTQSPPPGVDERWVERYVAGHRDPRRNDHHQLSYLPLPSIGHRHADQFVRRIMIAAPAGQDAWLSHLARRLEGRRLEPESSDEFGDSGPPTLVRIHQADGVLGQYTACASRWASVTPMILPGHDDRKPAKTRKLIEAALVQSGIDQPCTYQWSAFSRFRKSLSAHKYDRDRQPTGYVRPDHLQTQTAVHLTLEFNEGRKVPGPLAIGAGRHCGLGILAAVGESGQL